VYPTHFFEEAARMCGYRKIAGIDEAGRGPLAGPVVAAAVMLPRRFHLPGLRDSKLVKEPDRESLFGQITQQALGWAAGMASEQEIDVWNILEATKMACQRAIATLSSPPDYLLLDALHLNNTTIPQRAIIKGDQLSVSIAAASIIAKVTRDRVMLEYHQRYPQFSFATHKGYPTPEHLRLLAQFGPCNGHRLSFRPVRQCNVKRQNAN